MYSQLDNGHRNIGLAWLRYKDQLKRNFVEMKIIYSTFEYTILNKKNNKTNGDCDEIVLETLV